MEIAQEQMTVAPFTFVLMGYAGEARKLILKLFFLFELKSTLGRECHKLKYVIIGNFD